MNSDDFDVCPQANISEECPSSECYSVVGDDGAPYSVFSFDVAHASTETEA